MFTDITVADERTPVIAVVHDVQVVEENLDPSETDILVDAIATPTRYVNVKRGQRPKGIKWELLEPEQLSATPPLQELRRMQGRTSDA
jgi:5-formyltetrahydrofolate cyclo-ligase